MPISSFVNICFVIFFGCFILFHQYYKIMFHVTRGGKCLLSECTSIYLVFVFYFVHILYMALIKYDVSLRGPLA